MTDLIFQIRKVIHFLDSQLQKRRRNSRQVGLLQELLHILSKRLVCNLFWRARLETFLGSITQQGRCLYKVLLLPASLPLRLNTQSRISLEGKKKISGLQASVSVRRDSNQRV